MSSADIQMMKLRVTATSWNVSISVSQSRCMNELAAGEGAVVVFIRSLHLST
jgi:hypothetical protein